MDATERCSRTAASFSNCLMSADVRMDRVSSFSRFMVVHPNGLVLQMYCVLRSLVAVAAGRPPRGSNSGAFTWRGRTAKWCQKAGSCGSEGGGHRGQRYEFDLEPARCRCRRPRRRPRPRRSGSTRGLSGCGCSSVSYRCRRPVALIYIPSTIYHFDVSWSQQHISGFTSLGYCDVPLQAIHVHILLGQLEEWRLEHGMPTGESRHPDLATGQSWPPEES